MVIFYTNDLRSIPSKDLLEGTDKVAVSCVQGLGPLHRWIGNESVGRMVFNVPAPIVAYNVYMNSVDILDQRRSTNAAQRNEKRLNMSIFTLVLDLAMHNAYALHCWMNNEISKEKLEITYLSYKEFKRRIAMQLVEGKQNTGILNESLTTKDGNLPDIVIVNEEIANCADDGNQVTNTSVMPTMPVEAVGESSNSAMGGSGNIVQSYNDPPNTDVYKLVASNNEPHILLPTINKKCLACHLCKIVDGSVQRKTTYCCTACKVGFHLECFAFYHNQQVVAQHKPALDRLIRQSATSYNRNFKQSKDISSMKDIHLPFA